MSENPPRARARRADPVLEVDGLSKSFGERIALRDVSFDVGAGELLAVLGPNGAGKTTLLSILAGITRPDSGRINASNGEVGWVPQQAGLYRRLSVEENLRLFSHMERVTRRRADRAMLEQGGRGARGPGVVALQRKQRINIAIGLLGDPPALLLTSRERDSTRAARPAWEFVAAWPRWRPSSIRHRSRKSATTATG
jgi:ABC-type multidrug transport system ATPase subunit